MPTARILIVDDEESVVVTMKAIFQLDGYDVATSTGGPRCSATDRGVRLGHHQAPWLCDLTTRVSTS
jgi:CheY-like chemotaxis protein